MKKKRLEMETGGGLFFDGSDAAYNAGNVGFC